MSSSPVFTGTSTIRRAQLRKISAVHRKMSGVAFCALCDIIPLCYNNVVVTGTDREREDVNDQKKVLTTVGLLEKSPEQNRHDSIYAWAVTNEGLKNSRESSRHTVDNFRAQWKEREFENCFVILQRYMKTDPDFDLDRAIEWRAWINSIRSGDFIPE